MTTYTVTLTDGTTYQMRADFAAASAPLEARLDEHDTWHAIGHQTADASHRPQTAALLARDWLIEQGGIASRATVRIVSRNQWSGHPGTVRCQCGDITGTPCEWTGTPSDLVTVEYMPEDLRASHRAARNYGTYPHNGALRLHVTPACAERLTAGEDEADARIIKGE